MPTSQPSRPRKDRGPPSSPISFSRKYTNRVSFSMMENSIANGTWSCPVLQSQGTIASHCITFMLLTGTRNVCLPRIPSHGAHMPKAPVLL